MTNNNTNPSNPREDELDELLSRLRWPHCYVNHHEGKTSEQLHREIEAIVTEAKAALKAREATMKAEKVEKNKSYCGCPMCLHHTEAYAMGVNRAAQTNGEGNDR